VVRVAIWAPHPDDEIIGCYSILVRLPGLITVYYGTIDLGCTVASKIFDFDFLEFQESSESWDVVYAPDPYFDNHPEHRRFGHLAEQLFRENRINRLIYYSTQMNAPYICEVGNPADKRKALDTCYLEKSDLWKFDHRYWLFEGYNEWHHLDHG
jgi:LmbE family N-acetylglucosaminyl deacetylase